MFSLNERIFIPSLSISFSYRVSGVTDHFATSDEHALSIARSIVANLNWQEGTKSFVSILFFLSFVHFFEARFAYFCFKNSFGSIYLRDPAKCFPIVLFYFTSYHYDFFLCVHLLCHRLRAPSRSLCSRCPRWVRLSPRTPRSPSISAR